MKKIQSTFLPAVVAGLASVLTSGIALADEAFVANNGNNTIEEISSTGMTSTFIATDLNGPTGLAFNSAGDLFVANSNSGNIAEFSPTGTFIENYGVGLTNSRGIAFDSAGNLFVTDQGTGSIVEIPVGSAANSTGTVIASGLGAPNAVAFDASGNLYVTAVVVDTVTGGVATPFATAGLNSSNGLAFDAAGNLLVVNHNTNQVLEFSSTGSPLGSAVLPVDASSLVQPKTIAIDSAGDFYVTDFGDNTVSEYNSSGALITIFNSAGAFNGPCFVTTLEVVPEPATYALLGAGLALLIFISRRKAVTV